MITKKKVLKALAYVEDPDFKKDLVSLGMVRDLSISGNKIAFRLVLTTPACPMKEHLQRACTNAIKQMVSPEADVHITLDAMSQPNNAAKHQLDIPKVNHVVAVYSAKGGVGKSSIAANLAISLSKGGAKVGLLDADIYGPSIPSIFGLGEDVPIHGEQVEDKQKMLPIEKYGIYMMSLGMLTKKNQAIAWRGPMASTAVKQLISDVLWPSLDYLIIDMPPGTGDIHLSITQSMSLTGCVIVTTPQEIAVADSRRSIAMLLMDSIKVPILGLVENMSYFSPSDMPNKQYYLFGKEGGKRLAEEYKLPLLSQIPISEHLGESQDKGIPYMQSEKDASHVVSSAFSILSSRLIRILSMQRAGIDTAQMVERLEATD